MTTPGVCIISESWQLEQRAAVASIGAAGFKIKVTRIIPDLIVSSRGVSVAFIFVSDAQSVGIAATKERIEKMAGGFQFSYILSSVGDHNQQAYANFADVCFTCAEGSPGRPAVLAISSATDLAQCIVSIVGAHADCKEQATVPRFQQEMEDIVQSSDAVVAVLTTIPGIEVHEALSLIDGIGSLAQISSSNGEAILRCTDLSPEQAKNIEKFFSSYARSA